MWEWLIVLFLSVCTQVYSQFDVDNKLLIINYLYVYRFMYIMSTCMSLGLTPDILLA